MADPELQILASDIRILSLIFSALNLNWRPPQPKQGPVMGSLPKALSHISNILSIDTDAPVAVLGSATPENINVTVVQSITSDSESPEPPRQPFIAHSITPSLRDVGDILGEDDDSETMGVECSVAECLTLFAARREHTLTSNTILEWLVARGWDTLRARLQRSRDHFRWGDLFDLMENWSPSIYDAIQNTAIQVPSGYVYPKYGLDVSCAADGETTFAFGRGTASTLINALGRILKDVRRTVDDDPEDFAAAFKPVANSLLVLSCVVGHKAVRRVFTDTTLTQLLAPAWSRDHTENVTQALEDGWDPLTWADCDFHSDYALRYVRMLTSWASAVLGVSSPRTLRLLAAANVTVVSVLEPACAQPDAALDRVMQYVVSEIQRRLAAESRPRAERHREEALRWVRDAAAGHKDESSCYLHAEAGAMALVCDARSRPEGSEHGEYEYGVVSAEVPICVGQRCCALCSRLGELLNDHLGDELQFVLPGTHDAVLPWEPPPFGIPKSVLTRLRDELRDRLVRHAITQGRRNADIRIP